MDSFENGFFIGIDNSGDKCGPDDFFNAAAVKELGVSFVVYHYRPKLSVAEETRRAAMLTKRFEDHGISFVLNTESGNWADTLVSPDGYDWVERADGGHRFRFPPEVMAVFAASPAFAGVLYDEAEHCQMFRHLSITMEGGRENLPFFEPKEGLSLRDTDEHIRACAAALVRENEDLGAPRVLCEYVWPSLMHCFARAGMHLAYKQQKENWSNIWAACALGAARQYDVELWSCVDNWFRVTYPGHPPEEMAANLLFAYRIGVDKVYVESISGEDHFYSEDERGTLTLGAYGQPYKAFCARVAAEGERAYTHRDFLPDIAVVRFDDTYWGQGKNMPWQDILFGYPEHQSTPASGEWLRAFHTITHGTTDVRALSWGRWDVYLKPHRSFAPAKGPIVYDETVGYEHLRSASLLFLCGEFLSDTALAAAARRVREGATAVTSVRFAPQDLAEGYMGGTAVVPDGEGRWVITDDMASDEVKAAVAPLLGEPDEMSFRFLGGHTVRFKISEDGNGLSEV